MNPKVSWSRVPLSWPLLIIRQSQSMARRGIILGEYWKVQTEWMSLLLISIKFVNLTYWQTADGTKSEFKEEVKATLVPLVQCLDLFQSRSSDYSTHYKWIHPVAIRIFIFRLKSNIFKFPSARPQKAPRPTLPHRQPTTAAGLQTTELDIMP